MQSTSSHYKWIILALGSAFHFTFTAAWIFVPLIGDPETTDFALDLSLNTIQISWIYSAPLVAFVIFVFFGGMITDRIGARNGTILSGFFITTFGLLRGISNGFPFFFITSFLFGIGGGLLYPNLSKVVSDWFADERKGTASGTYLMMGGLGQVFSLAITKAILLPLLNWRLCFLFYGILCLTTSILWICMAREKETARKSSGNTLSIKNLKQILANKYILGLCVIILFAFSIFMGITNFMNDLLAEKGLTVPIYGYSASILSLGLAIGNVSLPSLSDRVRKRKLFLISCSSIAVLLLLILQFIPIGITALFIFFFLGLMAGTIIPLCLTICLEIKTIPEDLTGTASGLVLTFGFLGSLTSTLLFGTFISLSGIFLFCSLYLICLGIGSLLLSFKQQK